MLVSLPLIAASTYFSLKPHHKSAGKASVPQSPSSPPSLGPIELWGGRGKSQIFHAAFPRKLDCLSEISREAQVPLAPSKTAAILFFCRCLLAESGCVLQEPGPLLTQSALPLAQEVAVRCILSSPRAGAGPSHDWPSFLAVLLKLVLPGP